MKAKSIPPRNDVSDAKHPMPKPRPWSRSRKVKGEGKGEGKGRFVGDGAIGKSTEGSSAGKASSSPSGSGWLPKLRDEKRV
jgi:hypothetical protein